MANLGKRIREGVSVIDNVYVTLTDILTGEETVVAQSHNTALNYALQSIARWIGGANNSGYQAVVPPTQIELGDGSGTPSPSDAGLFSPISGTIATYSYVQLDTPSAGTTTFVFQIAAGIVTGQVTESLMRDIDGNGWYHTMFPAPFTPSNTQNITVTWETTLSA